MTARRSKPAVRIGTSGWSYPGWRQGFYKGVPQRRWLAHCAEHFSGIEVNATFYREPKAPVLERWAAETPATFAFAVKGHRMVTHRRRLADAGEPLARMHQAMEPLGPRLAAALWQLPPGLRRDDGLLAAFLADLGGWPETRHVMEFRHESWFDDAVLTALDEARIGTCISDAGRWPLWDAVAAGIAYVRLHGRERTYASAYSPEELDDWAVRVAQWVADGTTVHVYFDNDAEGAAPYDAMGLIERVRARGVPIATPEQGAETWT